MEGNQQKMRESLEWLLGFGYSTTDGGFHLPDAKMARNKIKAALSAPARNCDRFADAEAARQAWLDDAENWDEFGSPELELYEWLLDPVAEQKGEGDENK